MRMRAFIIAVILLGFAVAQAWDFEVGRAYQFANAQAAEQININAAAWYAMARYNIPATSEVLGAQLWLLPEVGVWVPDNAAYYGYVRLQLLLDQSFGTLFIDTRARLGSWPDITVRYELRIGVRFGWPR